MASMWQSGELNVGRFSVTPEPCVLIILLCSVWVRHKLAPCSIIGSQPGDRSFLLKVYRFTKHLIRDSFGCR